MNITTELAIFSILNIILMGMIARKNYIQGYEEGYKQACEDNKVTI